MTPTISVDTTPVLSPAPTMESSPASDSIVADMAGGEDWRKMVTIISLFRSDHRGRHCRHQPRRARLHHGRGRAHQLRAAARGRGRYRAESGRVQGRHRWAWSGNHHSEIAITVVVAGGLLTSVQADPDPVRQGQVKRRIAQYISKAEQLGKVFWCSFLLVLHSFHFPQFSFNTF